MIRLTIRSMLFLCLIGSSRTYEIPEPRIAVYRKGFEISIPHADGITYFSVKANPNIKNTMTDSVIWEGCSLKPDEDKIRWTYKNYDAELKVGDRIYYWIDVVKHSEFYVKANGMYIVNTILYRIPEPTIKVYRRGFELSIPNEAGLTYFSVLVKRNSEMTFYDPDTLGGYSFQPDEKNTHWTIMNYDAELKVGDKLHYLIGVVKDNEIYIKADGVYNINAILYRLPKPIIKIYHRGFTISIPNEDGITYLSVICKRNSEMTLNDPLTWQGYAIQPDENNTLWTYKNYDAELEIGDTLHYWMGVTKCNENYVKTDGVYIVHAKLQGVA